MTKCLIYNTTSPFIAPNRLPTVSNELCASSRHIGDAVPDLIHSDFILFLL